MPPCTFVFQRNELVGERVHVVDHFLLCGGDADLLHRRDAFVAVFQRIDLIPVIVIMLLKPCRGERPHLVCQVGGAVHETVGVVGQVKPLFIGGIELIVHIPVGKQGYHQEYQR